MDVELEGAQGVGDALDRIGLAVRVVVGGVDAPGVAGPRVARVHDAVEDGVAQVDVGRGHVDLGAQDPGTVLVLAGAHAREQVQVLLDGAGAVGGVGAGLGERPTGLADLVGGEVVHERLAVLDEVDGPGVQLLEVVRGVEQVLAPVEAQPADVGLDAVDVLLLLLERVRVVEPEIAGATELGRDAEVETDGLGMADVEMAVGLGWEPGDDLGRRGRTRGPRPRCHG